MGVPYIGAYFRSLDNDGAGTFSTGPSWPSTYRVWDVAAGNVDGDGKLDLITANSYLACATVFRGTGGGSLPPFLIDCAYGTSAGPVAVAVGDLDGDGYPEIVTADALDGFLSGSGGPGYVTVLRNLHSVVTGVPAAPRVPPSALAITRVWPTMAQSALHVAFALPSRGTVTAELYDVGGRRLARQDLGVLGPGAQDRSIALSGAIPPGVVWLRLREGGASAVAKAIIAR